MVTEEKSYYDVLRIETDADANEIKRAYYKLIREFTNEKHPEEFKELRIAYEVLSNEEERSEYDRILNTDVIHLDALNYIHALIENESYEEAKTAIKKQMILVEKSTPLFILLAKCEYNLRNYIQVLNVISKVEKPTSLEQKHLYEYSAYSSFHLKEYYDAEAFGLKLLEVDPNSSEFYDLLGNVYIKQEKFDKFINLLEKMMRKTDLTINNVPLLISGFMIQDSCSVPKEFLDEIKDEIINLGKSKTERLNLIRLIINEMESYNADNIYTGFYDLCELIEVLNKDEDNEITEYVNDVLNRLPDRTTSEQVIREGESQKSSGNVQGNTRGGKNTKRDSSSGWNLMIAIVLGIILSMAATPLIGIPIALIYYAYTKYILILLGVLFIILSIAIVTGSSL